MDDSCAVCAETLEWVAYGGCGHKEVCSTCVVRLRFICNDRRCCICKTESNVIFVTKALGDYTRIISDFSVLPSEPREGRVGAYWYHEDTRAFFDDSDHYKMIRAMCRLSCSVCDSKMEEQPNDGPKRRPRLFRNIEQLKGHLFHQHKLVMCSLCLEGRKVFICEQKLYTRAQLNQHISTGDSEVDGSESERGGFAGHPMCEFCRTPFYGDNELYSHMSTEHYTCHICQRQHPGQYEYYKNYDDLELHFRRDHFLCEDESCLAKKFIVFQSEAELKRHNTLEHGGRMSRSQRNAALQIPTSFRYRRSNEHESRRGRGRTFRRDTPDHDLSMAIQASLETANLDGRVPEASSSAQTTAGPQETLDADPLIPPFESVATTDSEPPSRYLQALSLTSRNSPLQEASFPPLPMAPANNQSRSHQDAIMKNTMAAQLRQQNIKNKKVPVSAPARPGATNTPAQLNVSPQRTWPALSGAPGSVSGSGQSKVTTESGSSLSSYSNSVNARAALAHESSSVAYSQSHIPENAWPALSNSSGSVSISGPSKPAIEDGSALSAYSASLRAKPSMNKSSGSGFSSSSRSRRGTGKISHSASAPNLVGGGSFDPSSTDFPPVSASQLHKFPAGSSVVTSREDVHTANKSLVERIRTALDFDEDKYATFKVISGEYRQGLIDTATYLVYVEQFGLSHLVLDLARLLPDVEKQKELIEIYNANIVTDTATESERRDAFPPRDSNGSKKGKKSLDSGSNTTKENLADSVMSTVRKLQSSYKPSDEEVEVLTKDGYRAAKGKSKVVVNESQADSGLASAESIKLKAQSNLLSGGGSGQNLGEVDGRNKQRKKTSKFHRVRLGDDSSAAILDLKNLNSDPDPDPGVEEPSPDERSQPTEALPVRGVWRNGGGQKLLTRTGK